MFRVLAIDGGGIRGIVAAHWLAELEARLESPLGEHFDLIAGTSTGAILGAAIANRIPARQIEDFYIENGAAIFAQHVVDLERWKLNVMPGVLNPKYPAEPLEEALQKAFTNYQELSALKTRTLIVSYDVFTRRPILMKSYTPEFCDLKVWEACRASSAAPVYFPAHILKPNQDSLQQFHLVDGGVVANNPSALALSEAASIMRQSACSEEQDVVLVSVGTGSLTRPIQEKQALTWGGMEWVFPLIDVVFDATSDSVGIVCESLLEPENYFRLQVELIGASDDLDDASDQNLKNLVALAGGHLRKCSALFDSIAAKLTG